SEGNDMPIQTFTSGRIRKADYDTTSQQLELHWDNRQVLAYKQVPEEVFRRLCRAPNPAAYWEDRIAEEYPKGQPKAGGKNSDAARGFEDLFGGGGAGDV
ncbi:MAG: KTSC domain-containing protein, partial [Betaproteobacteria bacterium]